MLLLTALIWGTAFVAQRSGMEYVRLPLTQYAAYRRTVLLPVIFLRAALKRRGDFAGRKSRRTHFEAFCAPCLCRKLAVAGRARTQRGGKNGFITSLYIVCARASPVYRAKVPLNVWVSVVTAVVGLYFLCITEELSISGWDLLVLLSALAFSVHILAIDHYSVRVDGVKMACIQYFACAGLSLFPMLALEEVRPPALIPIWFELIYAGAFSCGIAFTLQIMAQKYTEPALASLLMSVEAVFALLAGLLLLGERLTRREWIGCLIMFAAILLSQMPKKRLIKK